MEHIRFSCPHCGVRLQAQVRLAGRPCECGKCHAKLRVPGRVEGRPARPSETRSLAIFVMLLALVGPVGGGLFTMAYKIRLAGPPEAWPLPELVAWAWTAFLGLALILAARAAHAGRAWAWPAIAGGLVCWGILQLALFSVFLASGSESPEWWVSGAYAGVTLLVAAAAALATAQEARNRR
jgi:hypothetical protein